MNVEVDEIGLVKQAQASVQEARRLLASSGVRSIGDSAPHLESAAKCLKSFEDSFRARSQPAQPDLQAEVDRLRREVARVAALLEGAGKFSFGWAQRVYAACGYTANGDPAAGNPSRTLSIEG